jgi:hypothetical protein
MMKKLFAASVLSAAILGLAPAPQAWTQVSNSPDDGKVQYPAPGIKLEVAATEEPLAGDALSPSMSAACLGQLLQQVANYTDYVAAYPSKIPYMRWLFSQEASETVKSAPATRESQSLQLFKTAESCRLAGDFEKARRCYQQVHLLTPTSRVGRLSIDRLGEIEERMRESTEESDAPAPAGKPEQSRRDIRQGSIPLGLVEISY